MRRVAASGLADGVILMDVELDDPRIPVLREQGTQAALIGLPDDSRQLSCVDHDFAAAGALRADHLGNLGHRDIAFIGYGSRDLRTARRVRRTYPRRVRRAGRTARPALPAPPLRGHVREHRPGSRPHLRRAAGNHRVRRAERGGDLRVGTVQGTGPGHHPWFQHPPANSPDGIAQGVDVIHGAPIILMLDVSIVVRNIEQSGAFLFALPHPLTHRLPHRHLLGALPDFLAPPRHPHSRRHHGHPRNVTLASTKYPATKAI